MKQTSCNVSRLRVYGSLIVIVQQIFTNLKSYQKQASSIPNQNMTQDKVQHNYRVLTDRNHFDV